MTGGEIIALAGVLSTLGVAIFTQWWQRKGERERSAEQRQEREAERWLDYRRDVYVRFMRGADECWRAVRGQLHQLQSLTPSEGGDIAEQPEVDLASTSASGGLVMCADALAEMRLVAPSEVIGPATRYLDSVRFVEHFTRIAALDERRPGVNPTNGFDGEIDALHAAATEVLASMRADMGASPADLDGLGNIDPTIYGC